MDQSVGIEFGPKGQEAIFKVFEQVNAALSKLTGMASAQTAAWNKINASIAEGNRASQQFHSSIENMTRATDSFSRKSVAGLRGVAKELKAITAAAGGAGGEGLFGGTGARGDRMFGGPLGQLTAPGFLLRWMAWHKIMQGGQYFFRDILMGGAREKIMPELRDIGVIGFDRKQREISERMGQEHVRRWWSTGKQKDYLAALAEAGSAFDVNAPMFKGRGVEELNKMTQSAMILAGASKLKGEQASKLLQNLVHAQMTFMQPEELAKYETGAKMVSNLAAASAGKVGQIIKETTIWGTDVAYLMEYALPTALQKGWDIETLLGIGGAMKTVGLRGQKVGRGLREIMEGEARHFAALRILGGPDEQVAAAFRGLSGAQQKQLTTGLAPYMSKLEGLDPFRFYLQVGEWLKKAEARGIDLIGTVGLPKSWVGMIRILGRPEFLRQAEAKTMSLRGVTTTKAAEDYLAEQQVDPGWWKTRLSNQWEGMTQKWAEVAFQSGTTAPMFDRLLGSMGIFHKYLEGTASKTDVITSIASAIDQDMVLLNKGMQSWSLAIGSTILSTLSEWLKNSWAGKALKFLGIEATGAPVDLEAIAKANQAAMGKLWDRIAAGPGQFPIALGPTVTHPAETLADVNAFMERNFRRQPPQWSYQLEPMTISPLTEQLPAAGAGVSLSLDEFVQALKEASANLAPLKEPIRIELNVNPFEFRNLLRETLREDRVSAGHGWGTSWK